MTAAPMTAETDLVEHCAELARRVTANREKAAELRTLGEQAHRDPGSVKDWARVAGWRERAEALDAEAGRLEVKRQGLDVERSIAALARLLEMNAALRERITTIVEELAVELAPALAGARMAARARMAELFAQKEAIAAQVDQLRRNDRLDLGPELIETSNVINRMPALIQTRAYALSEEALAAVDTITTEDAPNAHP